MVPKPHRLLLGSLSGYAGEAAAFLRRRRHNRRPFARVYLAGGRGVAPAPGSDQERALFRAAAGLMDAAGGGERR
jgi:hypothetical protein